MVGTDKRGHGCIGEHQGRLVPRSIQGNGEGPPSIPPPLRILERHPSKSHRQGKRLDLHGPWTTRRRQKRPTTRQGRPASSYECVTDHRLAEMARRKTPSRPGDDPKFQCSRQGCRTTGNGIRALEDARAEYIVGCLCEIYSTGDGHARSDQGSWLRVRGARNWKRVGGADAHTHHVCLFIRLAD